MTNLHVHQVLVFEERVDFRMFVNMFDDPQINRQYTPTKIIVHKQNNLHLSGNQSVYKFQKRWSKHSRHQMHAT